LSTDFDFDPLAKDSEVHLLEFYVAAIILWSEDIGMSEDEAHQKVTQYLEKYAIDLEVDLEDFDFNKASDEDTLH
jgi:hypothetical protein